VAVLSGVTVPSPSSTMGTSPLCAGAAVTGTAGATLGSDAWVGAGPRRKCAPSPAPIRRTAQMRRKVFLDSIASHSMTSLAAGICDQLQDEGFGCARCGSRVAGHGRIEAGDPRVHIGGAQRGDEVVRRRPAVLP